MDASICSAIARGLLVKCHRNSDALLNQVNVAAGTRATLIPDVQGSIVVSLDSGSGVLTKAGFQPYGESGATASSTFGYTGARIAAGGLYDMRARFYSPAFGRFLQADPIGAAGGVNLYAYVGNDPLNRLDPLGLCDNPAGCGFGAGLSAGFQSGLLGPSGSSLSSQLQNSSSIGFQVGAFLGVEAGGFVGAIPYLASRGAFSGGAGAASQAAEGAEATIGDILAGSHPDTMIHLTNDAAGAFSGGVDQGTFFARLGDVSHMTVPEYQATVVMPAAAAGPGQPVADFVLTNPGSAGAFTQAGVFNSANVMEYTNGVVFAPSGYVPFP